MCYSSSPWGGRRFKSSRPDQIFKNFYVAGKAGNSKVTNLIIMSHDKMDAGLSSECGNAYEHFMVVKLNAGDESSNRQPGCERGDCLPTDTRNRDSDTDV